MVGASAECAGLFCAFGTFGEVAGGGDVFWGDPGAAVGVCAVDSVAGWDGPFGVSLLIFCFGGDVEMWEDFL